MIAKLLPGLHRLIHYQRSYLAGDLNSGIIVAILFIPQCMAYAIIAGVPPIIGLYGATLPLIIYTLFSSSKYLSVGPVSIVSLMVYSKISTIAEPESPQYLELIITVGLMVGSIQLILSFIKVGPLINRISPAVLNGFTSAAAIIIILNQLESFMGLELSPYQHIVDYLHEILSKFMQIDVYTFGIGLGSFLLLMVMKRYVLLSIGPPIVILLSTLLIYFFHQYFISVEIVGYIPKGLPSISFSTPDFYYLRVLFPVSVGIAFISFLESYAIAKTLAEKDKDKLNPRQELMSLGLANLSSSFIGSIPVAGAISRTALNYKSGAKSNFSSFITVFFIITTLFLFTPLFYYLPKASLAAIIIVAVSGLVDLKPFLLNSKTPIGSILFIITFLTTLFIDVLTGLIFGSLLSILFSFNKLVIYWK
ncbi:SulP family inorganic anion transporter [Bacillus sp. MRMR6]|uniref:SulP family inorganic anion transporter n=1 Tax=Bacillus sp. MRMR6 TaxID=1928617 RepID=UPI00095109F3|nr:SulP family inorganic anion transporter [Bacillus sp. MRMR6]OLS39285.1 hypothetical protein BTR25_12850 [Bacillus sp. MRMR6]